MTKTRGPLSGDRVELEKCVLADLQVDDPWLPLLVVDPERFTVPHFLGVVCNRLRDIGHTNSNVIHHYDTNIGVLRHCHVYCQPREEPGRKKYHATHIAS